MNGLILYDAACRALAEAKAVDEVKEILDTAVAMRAYAKQAKNKDLEADAVEIRMRATRRLDQLRQAQKETVGLNTGTRGQLAGDGSGGLLINPPDDRPTLASQGIDKALAHQGRLLGRLSDRDFEEKITEARASVARVYARTIREVEIEQRRQREIDTVLGLIARDFERLKIAWQERLPDALPNIPGDRARRSANLLWFIADASNFAANVAGLSGEKPISAGYESIQANRVADLKYFASRVTALDNGNGDTLLRETIRARPRPPLQSRAAAKPKRRSYQVANQSERPAGADPGPGDEASSERNSIETNRDPAETEATRGEAELLAPLADAITFAIGTVAEPSSRPLRTVELRAESSGYPHEILVPSSLARSRLLSGQVQTVSNDLKRIFHGRDTYTGW
jgi:hypothetical protein